VRINDDVGLTVAGCGRRNGSVTLRRLAERHAWGHAWRRRDSVDRHSYLMFIMLITCQSLFKMDDEVVAFVASAGLLIADAVQFQRRRRRKRTVWVKPWIQVRPVCGAYSSLISDLRNTDESAFRNYLRINVAAFEDLLSRVDHVVVRHVVVKQRQGKNWRGVGGGLDPHWKAANPHCKHRIKKS